MFQEKMGQFQELQRVAGRGRVPDNQIIGVVLDQLHDEIEHKLLFNAGCAPYVIDEVVVYTGEAR